MGQVFISSDCTEKYSCSQPGANVKNETFEECSTNAYCTIINDNPKCKCKDGYEGNGFVCKGIKFDY